MGAQVNIVDSVHIFIAIAAHKGLAAYALGSSVVDSQACPHCAVLLCHIDESYRGSQWCGLLLLVSVLPQTVDITAHRLWTP